MKLTNNHDLPDPIVWAVKYYEDEYQGSYGNNTHDISVTQLISPPQIIALTKQYNDELSEDVLDRIWALLGHSVHHILETAEEWAVKYQTSRSETLFEERYFATCEDWVISGKIDRYADGVLSDWKLCSVWEHVLGMRPEREQQLNILAWLMRQQDEPIAPKELEVHSFYRDWSKNQAKRGENYPPMQFSQHKIRLWSDDECEKFISTRVLMHKAAQAGPSQCTPEDQWAKPTVFAVMKEGRKSAVKLHEDLVEANEHLVRLGDKHSIVTRPGERTRCENYCLVKEKCPQYAREHEDE